MIATGPDDTIAAIASPPGPGLLGLVRVSGPDAWAVATAGFEPAPSGPPRRLTRFEGTLRIDGLRRPLRAGLAFGPGPRTYTGQPLAEIEVVGSPPVLRAVLADRLARGARAAGPGEFTLRAFLSGRIDLTRSEAVLAVIDADTPGQLDAALRQLAGGLAGPVLAARERLADGLAHLEANLDFADEPDVDPLGRARLLAALAAEADALAGLRARLRGRDRAGARPRVVLAGPPNAGKSRLFNALAGPDLAIVSDLAGTTRDYLEAPILCDGLPVTLVDTAGIEPANAPIAAGAQSARLGQESAADLVLDCRPVDAPPSASPITDPARPRLAIWTKLDAGPAPAPGLATSARTGEGLDALRAAIAAALRARPAEGDAPAATAERCADALARAEAAVRSALHAAEADHGDEYLAIDLRAAIDDLGRVVGDVGADDLLDRIFRRFCIGK